MYTVTVVLRRRGSNSDHVECEDLDEAINVLTDGVAGVLTTGAKVMWTVRCPSGRTVRGDITINSEVPGAEDITEHIDYVRDVLIADFNSEPEASSDRSPVNDDREGRTLR